MREPLTVDGRVIATITQRVYDIALRQLPPCPPEPGVYWITVRQVRPTPRLIDTCWIASYDDERMQPEHFAGWECLNPREEPSDEP